MCVATETTSPAISIGQSVATDPSNAKKGNIRRRLTFAPEISKVAATISREDYTAEEKRRCWWSTTEVSRSRKQLMCLIRSLTYKERDQHFVEMIDDSFETAQYLSTKGLGEKEVDSLFQDPSNYTSNLEAWALNGQERRGLEIYMSPFQMSHRSAKARPIRKMLLEAQRLGITSDEGATFFAEQSLTSRMYARWMGHADHSSAYFL